MKSAIVRKVYPSGCLVTFSRETKDPLLMLWSMGWSNATCYGMEGHTFHIENGKARSISDELEQKGFIVYNPTED